MEETVKLSDKSVDALTLPPSALYDQPTAQINLPRSDVAPDSTETEARIFTTIDKAKFFVISSVGFFSDGYFNSSWSYGENPHYWKLIPSQW